VPDTGRVHRRWLTSSRNMDLGLAGPLDAGAVLAQRSDADIDERLHLFSAPPGLLLQQGRFVLVAEQVRGSLDKEPDRFAIHPGELLRGIRNQGVTPSSALLGVPNNRLR